MTASFFVSAIQISCSARFAFVCRLFGSLFRTLAVLCTQQRCSRVVGHTSPSAFQKPSAPSATASSGAAAKPRRLRSSSRSRHDCAHYDLAPTILGYAASREEAMADFKARWSITTGGVCLNDEEKHQIGGSYGFRVIS